MAKPINQAVPDLTKFMDHMLHETVVGFKSSLSSPTVSPKDTGDFIAAWKIKGGDSNVMSYKSTYYLYNPLDYAEILMFGNPVGQYNWAKVKPGNWFPAFMSGMGQKIVDKAVANAEKFL